MRKTAPGSKHSRGQASSHLYTSAWDPTLGSGAHPAQCPSPKPLPPLVLGAGRQDQGNLVVPFYTDGGFVEATLQPLP